MTKPAFTQSQKRFQESLSPLFSPASSRTCLFIKSSSDQGVIRNGGRNGARYAPQSLMATFKRFTQDNQIKDFSFAEAEVADPQDEINDFHGSQERQSERIKSLLDQHQSASIIHIGGGHDHVYPLLKAASQGYSKVVVLNIDAHADTRTDEEHHSGTPFRQFAEAFSGEFSLYQIGLHHFANSFSTLSPLKSGKQIVLWRNEINSASLDQFFKQMEVDIDKETRVFFSLDADALNGYEIPGVSAVNPNGLSLLELRDLWARFKKLPISHPSIMGIYELNPVYDSLASVSMRTIGSFIFESIG